jgi:hypothetical protein
MLCSVTLALQWQHLPCTLPSYCLLTHCYYCCYYCDGDDDYQVHRDHIYGAHVSEYMEYLMEEDEALYKEQFATYIELGLGPENMEEVLQGVHKVCI